MFDTWIKTAKGKSPIIIKRINSQHWIINGSVYQPTGVFDDCCETQFNFELGRGKELAFFYYKPKPKIGKVFFYDKFISSNEPIFIYR